MVGSNANPTFQVQDFDREVNPGSVEDLVMEQNPEPGR